jgi:hypothetical protein
VSGAGEWEYSTSAKKLPVGVVDAWLCCMLRYMSNEGRVEKKGVVKLRDNGGVSSNGIDAKTVIEETTIGKEVIDGRCREVVEVNDITFGWHGGYSGTRICRGR